MRVMQLLLLMMMIMMMMMMNSQHKVSGVYLGHGHGHSLHDLRDWTADLDHKTLDHKTSVRECC